MGSYVPSLFYPNSPNFSSILGLYIPPSPIFPQDQCRCISLNPFHPLTHLNQSYHPSSSTSPKSFGSKLNSQYKKKKQYKNPSKKEDHRVSSNLHEGIKSKEISKKKFIRQVWVSKATIEDILYKSSKKNEKRPTSIWIPKFLLRESNIEQQLKLTFKLPKTSTSSSSKRILPFHVPKLQPLLSTHHVPSRIPSFTFSPSSHHPSRCVLMLIFPSFPSTLSQFFHALSFYLLSLSSFSYSSYLPISLALHEATSSIFVSVFLSLSTSLSISFQILCMSWFKILRSIISKP